MTEFTPPPELNPVRRTNRSILLIFPLGVAPYLIFAELGVGEYIASSLSGIVVLVALQRLLRGTTDSPLTVLKRCRDVSLSTVAGLTALVLVVNSGLLTFMSAFLPRLTAISNFSEFMPNSTWELLLLVLEVSVLVPFYEELVFRGVVLRAYRDARSPLFAVVFTSALFAFIHGSPILAFVFFPSSILCALVVLKTGQLWTVVAVHGLGNLMAILSVQFGVGLTAAAVTPTFGILGLVIAAAAFWLGFRWLGLPVTEARLGEQVERESIWTGSLVVVLVIAALINVLTTYEALRSGA